MQKVNPVVLENIDFENGDLPTTLEFSVSQDLDPNKTMIIQFQNFLEKKLSTEIHKKDMTHVILGKTDFQHLAKSKLLTLKFYGGTGSWLLRKQNSKKSKTKILENFEYFHFYSSFERMI